MVGLITAEGRAAWHGENVPVYDAIGATYVATRRPDLRIAAQIVAALGDAATVLNVGAGTGSYEPKSTVAAVEPSSVMIAQRTVGSAPAIRAAAEAIPLRSHVVDAALAVLTVHHWTDLEAGIGELCRVARRRIVILTWEPWAIQHFWLLDEYLQAAAATDARLAVPIDRLRALLGDARIEVVPVPHDCTDGFAAAYWRRPAAYLDPAVRAGISTLALTDERLLAPGLSRLAADLASGVWTSNHADLVGQETLDVGYRLLIADI